MNREIENFLSSFPYSASTKESYRRVLELLIIVPDLSQLDAAGLIEFLDMPGWGTNYSVVKVLVFTGLTLLLSGQRWRLMLAHGPLSLFILTVNYRFGNSVARRMISRSKPIMSNIGRSCSSFSFVGGGVPFLK